MELPAPLPDAVDAIVRAWKVRIANGRYGPDSVVSTKPSPLTDEVQRKAAARCLYLAAGAALTKLSAAAASGNPCRDLPIFFPGGLDAHDQPHTTCPPSASTRPGRSCAT